MADGGPLFVVSVFLPVQEIPDRIPGIFVFLLLTESHLGVPFFQILICLTRQRLVRLNRAPNLVDPGGMRQSKGAKMGPFQKHLTVIISAIRLITGVTELLYIIIEKNYRFLSIQFRKISF